MQSVMLLMSFSDAAEQEETRETNYEANLQQINSFPMNSDDNGYSFVWIS